MLLMGSGERIMGLKLLIGPKVKVWGNNLTCQDINVIVAVIVNNNQSIGNRFIIAMHV